MMLATAPRRSALPVLAVEPLKSSTVPDVVSPYTQRNPGLAVGLLRSGGGGSCRLRGSAPGPGDPHQRIPAASQRRALPGGLRAVRSWSRDRPLPSARLVHEERVQPDRRRDDPHGRERARLACPRGTRPHERRTATGAGEPAHCRRPALPRRATRRNPVGAQSARERRWATLLLGRRREEVAATELADEEKPPCCGRT